MILKPWPVRQGDIVVQKGERWRRSDRIAVTVRFDVMDDDRNGHAEGMGGRLADKAGYLLEVPGKWQLSNATRLQ